MVNRVKTNLSLTHPPGFFLHNPNTIKRWLQVRQGMSQSDVEGLLGMSEATCFDKELEGDGWLYEEGIVSFNIEKKAVCRWLFFLSSLDADWSMYEDIKDGMTQLQVVGILGLPGAISVDCSDGDKKCWTESLMYYSRDGEIRKNCIFDFSYPEMKWVGRRLVEGDTNV